MRQFGSVQWDDTSSLATPPFHLTGQTYHSSSAVKSNKTDEVYSGTCGALPQNLTHFTKF